MEIPQELKYTKDHEWVRIEGDTVVIGITEFAQSELGELVFVELPAAGKSVTKGATLCVVESTKAASDVYAPVSGTVKEGNPALTNDPSLVNKLPYTDGWIARLTGVSAADLGALMSAAQYQELLAGKA